MTFIIPPVWIGENVRPELRGTFLCLQNGSIVLGQFILALVAYGAERIPGKWSYQILVVLQFAFVVALLVPWAFFPESPYHFLKNKKDDEGARKALVRIHGSSDPSLIDAELARIKDLIAKDDELATLAGSNGHPLIQIWKGTDRVRNSRNLRKQN